MEEQMKLLQINKVRTGKYLINYELIYLNKLNHEKTFEIVSYKDINTVEELGNKPSGVAIVAFKEDKLLLLREFRMGINRYVFNLCAGRIEPEESLEECIKRELFEETGLELTEIMDVLRPAYAAVALSDVSNQLVFVKVKGEIADNTSENELIEAGFYSRSETERLLREADFTARAQSVAYSFVHGGLDIWSRK